MEHRPDVSVRGYYYNLDKSPYVWKSPYGDSYKLPSEKRVQMMDRRSTQALNRFDKLLIHHDLGQVLPDELNVLLRKYIIEAVYVEIVRG